MGLLHDLIRKIDDPALRERIQSEIDRLLKRKQFGLVFEEHLPECVILPDAPLHAGSKAALKTGYAGDICTVLQIEGGEALCLQAASRRPARFRLDEIVAVAEFGDPVCPALKPVESLERAPGDDLWHAMIEADNFRLPETIMLPREKRGGGRIKIIFLWMKPRALRA